MPKEANFPLCKGCGGRRISQVNAYRLTVMVNVTERDTLTAKVVNAYLGHIVIFSAPSKLQMVIARGSCI